MINYKNLFIYLLILTFLSSCGPIKEGFSTQKKDSTDEFLVEKKNPLKIPPDFEELPVPNTAPGMNEDQKNQELKKLITQKESENSNTLNNIDGSKKLEEFLLDKIKNN